MTKTPLTDECVEKSLQKGDDALTEDLLFHARSLEVRIQEAKVLLFRLADEMERDGYETLPRAAKAWLGSNADISDRR